MNFRFNFFSIVLFIVSLNLNVNCNNLTNKVWPNFGSFYRQSLTLFKRFLNLNEKSLINRQNCTFNRNQILPDDVKFIK